MEKLTIKDKTVEKAIQKGLLKLNTTREQVIITVIEEGKKGLFGFGQKDAIVELSFIQKTMNTSDNSDDISINTILEELKKETTNVTEYNESVLVNENSKESTKIDEIDNHYQHVANYLEQVAVQYGANDIVVNVKETAKKIIFQMETDKAGLLIGKHGKIINALQVLAQTMIYRENEKAPMVVVNIGDYRQKREEKLKEIADRTAKKVLRTNQAVFLEELPAFERKIIHARLSKYDNLTTHSEGREPHRYLVVSVKD